MRPQQLQWHAALSRPSVLSRDRRKIAAMPWRMRQWYLISLHLPHQNLCTVPRFWQHRLLLLPIALLLQLGFPGVTPASLARSGGHASWHWLRCFLWTSSLTRNTCEAMEFWVLKQLDKQCLNKNANCWTNEPSCTPPKIPKCLVSRSKQLPILCWVHKQGSSNSSGPCMKAACCSNLMLAACASHVVKTACNPRAAGGWKSEAKPAGPARSASHIVALFMVGSKTCGSRRTWWHTTSSPILAVICAWDSSTEWVTNGMRLLSARSKLDSSNIKFLMTQLGLLLIKRFIPSSCACKMDRAHTKRHWPACVCPAPSTSAATCRWVAVSKENPHRMMLSWVHFFQAPLPRTFARASPVLCCGNKWSFVLPRPDALKAVLCKSNDLCFLSWLFCTAFCLPGRRPCPRRRPCPGGLPCPGRRPCLRGWPGKGPGRTGPCWPTAGWWPSCCGPWCRPCLRIGSPGCASSNRSRNSSKPIPSSCSSSTMAKQVVSWVTCLNTKWLRQVPWLSLHALPHQINSWTTAVKLEIPLKEQWTNQPNRAGNWYLAFIGLSFSQNKTS